MSNVKEKLALGLFVGAVLTNPLTNSVVIEGLQRGLVFISREIGVYITVVAGAYFVGYILWNMWVTREKTVIPVKDAKTNKAGKFIKTAV